MPGNSRSFDFLDTVLDEDSSAAAQRLALDEFAAVCAAVGGITPDRSFDGWRQDTMLGQGVAINPQAAAFCIKDYRRSVVFLRGVYRALQQLQHRFADEPVRVLYAGCGPFALLLLPLLGRLASGRFDIHLLDIHQDSLDCVARLVDYFSLGEHRIHYVRADACHYEHAESLHLVIAETMQKALEQEPQFAVTANLGSQVVRGGLFIPEKIEVELCLAHVEQELATIEGATLAAKRVRLGTCGRHSLGKLLEVIPGRAAGEMRDATYRADSSQHEIGLAVVEIPALQNLASFDAVLFTRIQVFADYRLDDYDSAISLPAKCHDLLPLQAGACYEVSYQLGAYPRVAFRKISPG